MHESPSNAARLADHRARLAARETNRLTDADRVLIRERMARFASDYRSRSYPPAALTDGQVYGLVVRGAEAIGCSWVDLRATERAELDAMAATFAALSA